MSMQTVYAHPEEGVHVHTHVHVYMYVHYLFLFARLRSVTALHYAVQVSVPVLYIAIAYSSFASVLNLTGITHVIFVIS